MGDIIKESVFISTYSLSYFFIFSLYIIFYFRKDCGNKPEVAI